MSISDLMNAVRNGEFESKFKNCASTDEKISLFKKYGIVISFEQYREIENTVSAIKQGKTSPYDVLEDKLECGGVMGASENELMAVSAGRKLSNEENAVFEVLKFMPDSFEASTSNNKDDDVKLWKPKLF